MTSTALVATVHGNGPYIPVIIHKSRRYPCGDPMEDIAEAMEVAIRIAERIRAGMRSDLPEGYNW